MAGPGTMRLRHPGFVGARATPTEVTIPGAAIFLTVLPINYIGAGLRDALDPRKVLGKPFLRPLHATGYSGTIRKLFRPLIR